MSSIQPSLPSHLAHQVLKLVCFNTYPYMPSEDSQSTVTSTIVGSEATSNETSRNSFDGQYVSFKDIDGQYLIKEDDLPKFYGSLQVRPLKW